MADAGDGLAAPFVVHTRLSDHEALFSVPKS